MSQESDTCIQNAVARGTAMVLSLPSAGITRHHKSRFLSRQVDGSIWVESVPGSDALLAELLATQQPIGVTFKSGTTKVTLMAPIARVDLNFEINAATILPAILLGCPSQVKVVQRRACYRVRLVEDAGLRARMWRIPTHFHLPNRPLASCELMARLLDISLGGVGVELTPRETAPKIIEGERLRIELTYRDQTVLLEGRIRAGSPAQATGRPMRWGVKFKSLEDDLEGRRTAAYLSRVIGDLQREEARRTRRATA